MNPDTHEPELNTPKLEKNDPSTQKNQEKQIGVKLNKDTYELNMVEHDLIEKYQPEFLDKGNEHIIYRIPKHPNIVVKASIIPLKDIISWTLESGQSMDSMSPEVENRIREYLQQENERYQQLVKHFESDHVLNQKKFLLKVPITEDILNSIYDRKPIKTSRLIHSVITIQRSIKDMDDPKHLSLNTCRSEEKDINPDAYKKNTDHLIFGENQEQKISKEEFLNVQPEPNLEYILKEAENTKGFKNVLKDLIEKLILYTQETGENLDIIGKNNIILSQKDGKPTYLLIDALHPFGNKSIEITKNTLRKISTNTEIDNLEKKFLRFTFNVTRTINGLAEVLGIEKRINIVPNGMKQEGINFLNIIRSIK